MEPHDEVKRPRFRIEKLEERIAPQANGALLGEINKDDPLTVGVADRPGGAQDNVGLTYCKPEATQGLEDEEVLTVLVPPGLA